MRRLLLFLLLCAFAAGCRGDKDKGINRDLDRQRRSDKDR